MADASPLPSIADVVLAVVAVISAIIAVFARQDTKRQAEESKRVADATVNSIELQKQELELHSRELHERDRASLVEHARAYHQKLREFVWVRWIQCAQQYPSGNRGTGDLNVTPCFESLDYPYRTYFDQAIQHLDAYGLTRDRDLLMGRINEHNLQVRELNEKGRISPAGMLDTGAPSVKEERERLLRQQMTIWNDVQEFSKGLQEVVSNLEDGQLKGECDFERNLRKELDL